MCWFVVILCSLNVSPLHLQRFQKMFVQVVPLGTYGHTVLDIRWPYTGRFSNKHSYEHSYKNPHQCIWKHEVMVAVLVQLWQKQLSTVCDTFFFLRTILGQAFGVCSLLKGTTQYANKPHSLLEIHSINMFQSCSKFSCH